MVRGTHPTLADRQARQQEAEARQLAELQAQTERQARQVAESQAQTEKEARQLAEFKLQQLAEELARLRQTKS